MSRMAQAARHSSWPLAVAHVVRAFGERLRAYKDSTQTIEQPLTNYEDIVDVVGDPATKTVFEVRDITKAQAKLVTGIADAVHAEPLKHGEKRTLNAAFEAVRDWWRKIPEAAKNISIYEKKDQPRLKELRETLDKLGSMDRFDVLLERLPGIYAGEPVGKDLTEADAEQYSKGFAADVPIFESGLSKVKASVAAAINPVFGASGDLIECEKAVRKWYEALEANQRDAYKCEDEDARELLKAMADTSTTFDTKICRQLPQTYGFGPVENWTSSSADDFAARIKQAKAAIDEAKPEVPVPKLKSKVWELDPKEKAEVALPKGTAAITYTTDQTDPKQSSSATKVTRALDLASVLGASPSVIVKMRAVDPEGNTSDLVSLEVISKARKYEIKEEKDLFGKGKGSFILPEDADGLVSVITSLLHYARERGFVDTKKAKAVEDAAKKLLED